MKANTRRTRNKKQQLQEAAAPSLSLSLSLSLCTSPHNRKYITKLSQMCELLSGTSFNKNNNNNNNGRSLHRDMQQKNEKLTFYFIL